MLLQLTKTVLNKLITPFEKRIFATPHTSDSTSLPDGACVGSYKSFGPLNPDKFFYVIKRDHCGSGFFSNFSFVWAHVKLAIAQGMIPVVDFENFPTHYNQQEAIDGTHNAWLYFFRPVSEFGLNDVYQSRNVLFCDSRWPPGLSHNLSRIPALFDEIYVKRLGFSAALEARLREAESLITDRTVGVHFRGKEQNVAPRHRFGPTVSQMIACLDLVFDRYDVNQIFAVTENPFYLDRLIQRYGRRVVYLDSYRSRNKNAFNENPRERHRFLLGMEICVEGILLSKCRGLVCSESNVSEFAVFHNHGKFEFIYKIDNGLNSQNRMLALTLYSLKRHLPRRLGGLKSSVIITERGRSTSEIHI